LRGVALSDLGRVVAGVCCGVSRLGGAVAARGHGIPRTRQLVAARGRRHPECGGPGTFRGGVGALLSSGVALGTRILVSLVGARVVRALRFLPIRCGLVTIGGVLVVIGQRLIVVGPRLVRVRGSLVGLRLSLLHVGEGLIPVLRRPRLRILQGLLFATSRRVRISSRTLLALRHQLRTG
ncbi:MAG: hypothetical protein QOC95_129, partial [Thermoleophilaceae bacterium]|nr:hypothetical protein [Thermoleophilaceae bacterium]